MLGFAALNPTYEYVALTTRVTEDKAMSEYNRKRNFTITSEPVEDAVVKPRKKAGTLRFVIQKHDASHLHYDFRLELDGTLKSWAIPKGPSLDPHDKRLAVHVEDHPLGYATFEGSIPKGQYGGGDVIVWDQGVWQPHGDPRDAYQSGKLKFTLAGEKLSGDWTLVRTRIKGSGNKEQWLLIKERDEVARPASEYSVVDEQPNSVISGASVGKAKASKKSATVKPAKEAANQPHSGGSKNHRETLDKVSISHPERVIDADSGTQKIQLAQFYHDIADWVLPHLKGRPVSLLRAPDGVAGQQFFQKHAQQLAIPNITHLDQAIDPDHAPLMQIDSLPALIGAVQMGCIELHTWGATSANVDKPDRLIFDLDPDPALPWESMLEATRLTLATLDDLGLNAWLKTSGGKGMHIVVPLSKHAGWDTVKAFANALATFMTEQHPKRFIDKMGPQNRIGKIFIDYLRNQRGASTASAYSVRARPGLPVSVPIERAELDGLKSAVQWTVGNLRERLETLKHDPWHDYHNRQRLTRAHWKRLGAEPV